MCGKIEKLWRGPGKNSVMVWGWLKKIEDHWDSGGIPVKIKNQKKESDHHQLFSYNTKRFAYALL